MKFREQMTASGIFEQRRREQNVDWFNSLLQQAVMQRFTETNGARIQTMETAVGRGELPVSMALSELLSDEEWAALGPRVLRLVGIEDVEVLLAGQS